MSRLGKRPIELPAKVEVSLTDGRLRVKGPLGEVTRAWPEQLSLTVADGAATIAPKREGISARELWGSYAAHLKNMIKGVTAGFEKKMQIEGVGYRAAVAGDKLTLNLGFSHPVILSIPVGIKVLVEKSLLAVSGFDKELVGQFAAVIRGHKPPEPYKGKGIRYEGEYVRRKEGKKVVA